MTETVSAKTTRFFMCFPTFLGVADIRFGVKMFRCSIEVTLKGEYWGPRLFVRGTKKKVYSRSFFIS